MFVIETIIIAYGFYLEKKRVIQILAREGINFTVKINTKLKDVKDLSRLRLIKESVIINN